MTRLSRKLMRLTHSKHNGEDIVIELHATALFLRTKGSRDSFPSPTPSCTNSLATAPPNAPLKDASPSPVSLLIRPISSPNGPAHLPLNPQRKTP